MLMAMMFVLLPNAVLNCFVHDFVASETLNENAMMARKALTRSSPPVLVPRSVAADRDSEYDGEDEEVKEVE